MAPLVLEGERRDPAGEGEESRGGQGKAGAVKVRAGIRRKEDEVRCSTVLLNLGDFPSAECASLIVFSLCLSVRVSVRVRLNDSQLSSSSVIALTT